MKTQIPPSALMALLQTVLFARSISGLAINSMDLHILPPRNTCGGRENLSTCGQGLPSNFCCPSGNTCIPLYNTNVEASAICCPSGSDCTVINIITCDTSFQDPNKFPDAPLHSTNISQSLPTCGQGCCPLGYECVDDVVQCRMKNSTKQPSTSSASTESATTTSTSSSTATSLSSSATISSVPSSSPSASSSPNTIEPTQTSDSTKAGLVLAGLFPGLLAGAAIAVGVLYFLRRRRNKLGYKGDSGSSFFGPPTPYETKPPKISEPIYKPGMSDRVVFGHNRTPSGNEVPVGTATPYGDFYKPSNNQDRSTADSVTLVSPPQSGSSNTNKNEQVRTLDPPFETPTKPGRSAAQQKSFFSSSSSRSSIRNTQRTTRGSMETISMLMGAPRVPSYQRTPEMRQTTYSDVYRAAGISPSQVKSTRPSVDTQR